MRAALARALGVYGDRRVLIVTLLGFASGLPLALTGSTLALWMAERGVDLGTIGLFSLVGLPYVLKFVWAPVIDALALPLLTRRLGRRRGWIVATQLALIAAIAAMGMHDPADGAGALAAAALLVAVLSATQDIVIDAFRVEYLDEPRYAAGMAGFVAAYRIALLAGGAGTVILVAGIEDAGFASAAAWGLGFALTGLSLLLGTGAALMASEPEAAPARVLARPLRERMAAAVVDPFRSFMRRGDWLWLLFFVALFKLGDALAAAMLSPFAIDLGFDKETIAAITKGLGLAAALAGGFAGGALGRVVSIRSALWIAGIAQMVSNLAFTALALIGPQTWALSAAIAIEAFCGGIGTVLFVAFLSSLCDDRAHTATQYALLSALAALGRTLFSASAGFVAAEAGWAVYFALTALAALPGLALLAFLGRRPGVLAAAAPAR